MTSIQLEIQNTIDLSFSLIVFDHYKIARFELLSREKIVDIMLKQIDEKHKMNFDRIEKFQLNDQEIEKNFTYSIKVNISIV
jgi:uncharacterized protein with PhoU and TrkA domain